MSRPLDLVLAPDAESFIRAARPLMDDPGRLEEITPALVRETALRHYRPSYPKHVPHAVFSLLGGLEARDLLEGPERARPVIKALSYIFREKHFDPFPIEDFPAAGDEPTLVAALAAGSFADAYPAACALVTRPNGPARVRDALLEFGITDSFNLGHRVIYPAKVLLRLAADPGLDAPALLFPAMHYLCLAPRDGRFVEALAAAESGNLGQAPDSPKAVIEEIFADAVRRLATAAETDWVTFAHVANYAAAVRDWQERGGAPERAVLTAGIFLADAIAGSAPAEVPQREAISGPEVERELLLTVSRIDGGHAFSHDLKVVANAIRTVRNGSATGLATTLADTAAFLARFPAESPILDEIFPPA